MSTPNMEQAGTVRNDVNIKKDTLQIEPDETDPGKFLVTFIFDAAVAGSITIVFFAKEGEDCHLSPTKDSLLPPVTVQFQQGFAQKFQQPSGTGIDFSTFTEEELCKGEEMYFYPLAVKAEGSLEKSNSSIEDSTLPDSGSTSSQITHAVFEKNKGDYRVRVVKQILWVNGVRYELQEIYGLISATSEFHRNDPETECLICVTKPRDTTVLPCRHTCMCHGCAMVLRFQTNRCPVCRQTIDRLLEVKVS